MELICRKNLEIPLGAGAEQNIGNILPNTLFYFYDTYYAKKLLQLFFLSFVALDHTLKDFE